MQRQVEEQAREDSRLLHSMGSGALAAAAVLLNDLIDPQTGGPKRPAQARDVLPLTKAGIECLAAAGGQTPGGPEGGGSFDAVLKAVPEDVRISVLRGLRSLMEWQESTAGRR